MEGKVVLVVACPICKLQERIIVKKEFKDLGRTAWQMKHKKKCKGRQRG